MRAKRVGQQSKGSKAEKKDRPPSSSSNVPARPGRGGGGPTLDELLSKLSLAVAASPAATPTKATATEPLDGPRPEPPPPPQQPAAPAQAEEQVAGLSPVITALREFIAWPSRYGSEAAALGVSWPRGILLHGPPGTGKTLAVRAVCAECSAEVFSHSAGAAFGSYTGESERRLRELFESARAAAAASGRTAVVFLDEIDALCPRRDGRAQHEARVVAQLLTLMDGAAAAERQPGAGHVVVIGATNRPNRLDPALRRPGRFDREIVVTVPVRLWPLQHPPFATP